MERQIKVYLAASGASVKDNEVQVAIILNCAGPKVVEVFDRFTWNGTGKSKNDVKDPPPPGNFCLKLNPHSIKFWNHIDFDLCNLKKLRGLNRI